MRWRNDKFKFCPLLNHFSATAPLFGLNQLKQLLSFHSQRGQKYKFSFTFRKLNLLKVIISGTPFPSTGLDSLSLSFPAFPSHNFHASHDKYIVRIIGSVFPFELYTTYIYLESFTKVIFDVREILNLYNYHKIYSRDKEREERT